MQDTFGQTDALALAVASWMTTNTAGFSMQFTAERRFGLITDLKDIPAFNQPVNVDVFPDMEHSDRAGISTAFSSHYAIHVVIQQQTSGTDEEAQCALLARFRSEIIEGIKKRAFQLTNAVHPVANVILFSIKNPDKGMYNLARLLDAHVFESDTILIFKASA